MAFDKDKVIQFVQKNYPKVGSTARSSLRSALYRLSADAKPEDVFVLVDVKLRAAGYYENKRDILKQWQRDRIAW